MGSIVGAATETRGLTATEVAEALGVNLAPGTEATPNAEGIERIAKHLIGRSDFGAGTVAKWDDPRFWLVGGEPTLRSQYFAVGTAINFRFWDLEDGALRRVGGLLEGEEFVGAMYMWRALRLAIDRGVPLLDAQYLESMSQLEFASAFRDDSGRNPLEVAAEERLLNLKDLGTGLLEHWDGRFSELVAEAKGSVVKFAVLSNRFRAFDDPLFKLTMLNVILHSGSGIASFRDDTLPAIDYHLVKESLRQGLVDPSPRLARKLSVGELLEPDDALELRRASLSALLEVSAKTGISGQVLDNRYWWNRVKCRTREPVCLNPATADECPFYGACLERVQLGLPLELTRYY